VPTQCILRVFVTRVVVCRFVGNKVDEDGAAIHASQWGMVPSRLEVHDSYFEGNEVRQTA
jgi:hypothetical protein